MGVLEYELNGLCKLWERHVFSLSMVFVVCEIHMLFVFNLAFIVKLVGQASGILEVRALPRKAYPSFPI